MGKRLLIEIKLLEGTFDSLLQVDNILGYAVVLLLQMQEDLGRVIPLFYVYFERTLIPYDQSVSLIFLNPQLS